MDLITLLTNLFLLVFVIFYEKHLLYQLICIKELSPNIHYSNKNIFLNLISTPLIFLISYTYHFHQLEYFLNFTHYNNITYMYYLFLYYIYI